MEEVVVEEVEAGEVVEVEEEVVLAAEAHLVQEDKEAGFHHQEVEQNLVQEPLAPDRGEEHLLVS